jgi:hypothetical protein
LEQVVALVMDPMMRDAKKATRIVNKFVRQVSGPKPLEIIVDQFIVNVFYIINSLLFNAVLDDSQGVYCTPNNGLNMKLSLSILEDWVNTRRAPLLNTVRQQLSHIAAVCTVFVTGKALFADEEIRKEVVPELNAMQLHKILKNFKPDAGEDSEAVGADVLAAVSRSASEEDGSVDERLDSDKVIPM